MSTLRWYRSTNKNAPTLGNSWGDFVKLLDACLVDGFSEQSISAASVKGLTSETNDYITFTYLEKHGYLPYQMLLIEGSDIESINGLHRILEVSSDGLSLTFKTNVSITDVGSLLNIKTKLPSANWLQLYTDTNKRIYKGTADQGKNCCLFVDNSKHELYQENWAKQARIGYAEDFETFEKPLGVSIPSNWNNFFPSKINATDISMGSHTIYYATHTSSNTYSTTYPNYTPSDGAREWTLIADDSCFYFITALVANNDNSFMQYGFGQYDTLIEGFEHNVFLSAIPLNMQQNTNFYMSLEGCQLMTFDRAFYTAVNFNTAGADNPLYLRSIYSVTRSGSSDVYSPISPTVLFKPYIHDGNSVLLGSMRNFYWLPNNMPFQHNQTFTQNGSIYLALNTIASHVSGQACYKIGEL